MTLALSLDARRAHRHLEKQLVHLFIRWHAYVALFGRTERNIALFNSIAPGCFWVLQEALHDDVLMGIGRICDSPSTGKGAVAQENLSLRQLKKLISSLSGTFPDTLETMLQQVDADVQPIKALRHKRLAHMDLAVSLAKAQLDEVSRNQIAGLLARISAFLNEVSRLQDEPPALHDEVHLIGDADVLVKLLERHAPPLPSR